MGDWPQRHALTLTDGDFVSTSSLLAGLSVVAISAQAWPAANLSISIPFRLATPKTVYKLVAGAGVTAAGNFDIGVKSRNGKLIVASGSTAKGASTEQVIDVTDTVIGPGIYFLTMSANGTDTYIMFLPSGTTPVPLQKARLAGCLEKATDFPLADGAFSALSTSPLIPSMAVYFRPY